MLDILQWCAACMIHICSQVLGSLWYAQQMDNSVAQSDVLASLTFPDNYWGVYGVLNNWSTVSRKVVCLHHSHFLTIIEEFVVCSINGQQCRAEWCACITHIYSQRIAFTHTWYPTVMCLHHSHFLTIIGEFGKSDVLPWLIFRRCASHALTLDFLQWCACLIHISWEHITFVISFTPS